MARQGITGVAEYLASQGRNGDNAIAHVTSGETIIPKELVDKYPSLKQEINASFKAEEVDPAQYVIGSGVMSINPETGMPEFGWLSKTWKSVRKTVKKAGPVIGAVVGGMIGGPIGASIGAGIGTKTSAKPDVLRNMAIAFMGASALQGAGVGGATSAARTAASAAGGWSSPFSAMTSGVGAFFTGANWTPMAAGQSGIGGFFQDLGSGAARSLGLGGTQTLQAAGLTNAQASKVAAEMAASGVDAVTAAGTIGITNPTILTNLATVGTGPGLSVGAMGSYGALNPLQQFGVQTLGDVALGLHKERGDSGGNYQTPSYLTGGLRSGPAITPMSTEQRGATPSLVPTASRRTGSVPGGIAFGGSNRTGMNIAKGNILLDRLADLPGLTTDFPTFEAPTYAANGGFVGSSRSMFRGGGFAKGPGGPKEDLIDAKLSNGEFVMTAEAVKNAGSGDVQRGAQEMYRLMNTLERRA
jgi:hypothetical protein